MLGRIQKSEYLKTLRPKNDPKAGYEHKAENFLQLRMPSNIESDIAQVNDRKHVAT